MTSHASPPHTVSPSPDHRLAERAAALFTELAERYRRTNAAPDHPLCQTELRSLRCEARILWDAVHACRWDVSPEQLVACDPPAFADLGLTQASVSVVDHV